MSINDKSEIVILALLLSIFFWIGTEFNNPDIKSLSYITDIFQMSISTAVILICYKILSLMNKRYLPLERYKTILKILKKVVQYQHIIQIIRYEKSIKTSFSDYYLHNDLYKNTTDCREKILNQYFNELYYMLNQSKYILSNSEYNVVEGLNNKLETLTIDYIDQIKNNSSNTYSVDIISNIESKISNHIQETYNYFLKLISYDKNLH